MTEQSALNVYATYETCIGIEVHVQLDTQSKIFCSCPHRAGTAPNTNICPICAGYPGTLPVLNAEVVHYAIMMGLATHCTISQQSTFARKHYFYPDLPKNFQITQAEHPICSEGFVTIIDNQNAAKKIRLIRIHMEEDAGKNIHSTATNESFVDLNRTGTPLLEIVSYPDISTAHEARAYLKLLRNIVLHLGIGTGNMEDGALRADTNISVRKKGATKLGTKVELKNINSFKFVADAIEYEIKRQIDVIESGGLIIQETRLWDTQGKQTIAMRSKEEAADYRYFSEPDLPPVYLEHDYINTIKSQLPELPDKKYERYSAIGLTPDQTTILIDDMALAHYFDATYQLHASPNLINWILRDVIGYLKENKLELTQFKLSPTHLAELMTLIDTEIINIKVAQDVFKQSAQTGTSPQALVKEQKLEQIGNEQELELVVKQILEHNKQQVTDYKNGNQKLFGFFVGQIMKATGGKANPQMINNLLRKHLS